MKSADKKKKRAEEFSFIFMQIIQDIFIRKPASQKISQRSTEQN